MEYDSRMVLYILSSVQAVIHILGALPILSPSAALGGHAVVGITRRV